MTSLRVSGTPPPGWDHWCQASEAVFGSENWQGLLERSFNCRTLYFSDDSGGFAVSVFRGGPFRIGYLGFPVGGVIGNPSMNPVAALRGSKSRTLPLCVRVPGRAGSPLIDDDLPHQVNPETVIEDLQSWSLESVSKNLRRDVRKAGRSGLSVARTEDPAVGDTLYDLYSATVRRHGGSLRYNAAYFRGLIELAGTEPSIRVYLATAGSTIAGFVATVGHQGVANYLHGAARAEFRSDSPSDLLLSAAIDDARCRGFRQFNLMASPPGQPSLVRYKEKWGGVTRDLKTSTVILRPGYYVFRAAEKLLSFFS